MDDKSQNQNPVTDPTSAAVQAPVADATQAPAPAPAAPANAMGDMQIPDLPTAPTSDAQPSPAVDVMGAMQQMATNSAPQVAQPTPAQMTDVTPAAMPAADAVAQPASQEASSLGPVTMEDLMEELQHIEDKLDEMDEKL